jgi:hypothetical protein
VFESKEKGSQEMEDEGRWWKEDVDDGQSEVYSEDNADDKDFDGEKNKRLRKDKSKDRRFKQNKSLPPKQEITPKKPPVESSGRKPKLNIKSLTIELVKEIDLNVMENNAPYVYYYEKRNDLLFLFRGLRKDLCKRNHSFAKNKLDSIEWGYQYLIEEKFIEFEEKEFEEAIAHLRTKFNLDKSEN